MKCLNCGKYLPKFKQKFCKYKCQREYSQLTDDQKSFLGLVDIVNDLQERVKELEARK